MIDLKDYGYINDTGEATRIVAVHKERYEIVSRRGQGFARLKTGVYYGKGGEPFPTVGDFVEIVYLETGDSQIVKTLPRRTFFARLHPTPGIGEQAVAANFDYVFILQSLNQNFNVRRLERYVTLAWQSGGIPVILLTKADLAAQTAQEVSAAQRAAAGVDVYPVSAVTGDGLSALDGYLQPGKTVVLLGSSGVGKSSLINALAGDMVMQVGGIREEDARGKHTTTHRQLIRLPGGAMLIDTPGMRELGMWDVNTGLEEAFTDVETLIAACRFSDCRHESEPGCAVRAAIGDGRLSQTRWDTYLGLKREAEYAEDKREYLRKRQAAHKKREIQRRRGQKG